MSTAQPVSAAPQLRFFDAFVRLGALTQPPPGHDPSVEALLEAMDLAGIESALVMSAETNLSSPLTTNPDIAEACAAHERLHAVWSILPSQTGEMPVEALLEGMRRHDIRALRADPEQGRYQLNRHTFGDLFDELVERRIPLFLRAMPNDWPQVTALLEAAPELTLIAHDMGPWGTDRSFRPLIERFPNFYIEISSYELDGGVTAFVERYGPDHLLYGSAWPCRPMGGASLRLRNEPISMDAKEKIAHANLERLLQEATL